MIVCANPLPRPTTSLQAYLDHYIDQRLDLSKLTAQQLAVSVRLLDRFAGASVRLTDLQRKTVIEWMRWLRDGPPPRSATVNSKRRAILTLWRHAAAAELIEPPPEVPCLREPTRLPVAWSLDEVARILAACDRQTGRWEHVPTRMYWRLIVLLIWDTGCRIGEVLKAKLEEVDLQRRTWHVPAENTKGRRCDRLYRLHSETIDLIRRTVPPSRKRLVPYPYRHRQIWVEFGEILRDAGLPDDRRHKFHALRRTAESYAAAARGIGWAAAAVGHSPAVARKSYVNPLVAPGPSLAEVLPRPWQD